ncbi:MAG: APC family permease [Gemmatimonadetes bacterium]|nr:APC family permease [Gemmatimonadota bacterium]
MKIRPFSGPSLGVGDTIGTASATKDSRPVNDQQSSGGLARTIGPFGLGASVINLIIGSSIFVFPATIAATLGGPGILAYVVAAALMGLIALCFAESGSRVTGTGGMYAYVETAFGPFTAWLVGLLTYLGVQLVATAVVGTVFIRSLSVLVPVVGEGMPRALILVLTFGIFAWINIRGGARGGVRVVELVTFAKLAPLILLGIIGLVAFRPEFVRWDVIPPAADIGRMAMRLLYLFAGLESALAVSGELRDPARTVPRGILGGLVAATIIYLGVQFAAQGLLGPELPTHTQAPLADAAAVVFGDGGRTFILLAAVISTIGFLSAAMLIAPRTLYAMALAGRIPRAIAAVHPRFGSPAVAIMVHAALSCVLAIVADFDTLTALSSSALLLIYFVCCAATLVLQRRRIGEDGAPFRLIGGPVIPLAAMGLVVVLATTLERREVGAVGVTVLLAAVTYFASRKAQGAPDHL